MFVLQQNPAGIMKGVRNPLEIRVPAVSEEFKEDSLMEMQASG